VVSNKAIRAALYTKLNVASVTSQLGSGSASLVHEVAPPTAAFGSLTITGGSLMHLARESGIDYTETDGDKTYRHAGSLYRLIVQT
jgi:hypothetical protein